MLRFQKGEEVFDCLKKFLSEQKIAASSFSAIGAASDAELFAYIGSIKKYKTEEFRGDLEILSLTGNSALLNGEVALHAHAVLGKKDFSLLGGHVNKLVISVTCEMFLIQLDGKMERKLDEETNLNLLEPLA